MLVYLGIAHVKDVDADLHKILNAGNEHGSSVRREKRSGKGVGHSTGEVATATASTTILIPGDIGINNSPGILTSCIVTRVGVRRRGKLHAHTQ